MVDTMKDKEGNTSMASKSKSSFGQSLSKKIFDGDPLFQKQINIGYMKSCDCKINHLNCMTAKEWLKHQLGVWQFYYEGRDIRDKTHRAGAGLKNVSKSSS